MTLRESKIPDNFLVSPSVTINDFADYLSHSSIRYIKQFSLQSSISFFAHIFGRKAVGETGLPTSSYNLLVGGSGVGKGYCKNGINSLDDAFYYKNILATATSESGLRTAFVRNNPNLFMLIDEFGDKFAGRETNNTEFKAALREVTNDTVWRAKGFSGFKNGVIVDSPASYDIFSPCLNLLGFTTVEQLASGLTDADIKAGSLNRFNIVDAHIDEVVRNEFGVDKTINSDLGNKIMSLSMIDNPANRDKLDYSKHPDAQVIKFDDGVLNWLHDTHDKLMIGKNAAYNVRVIENAIRQSLTLSLADGLNVVPREYAEWCVDQLIYWGYNVKKISESAGVDGYSVNVKKFLDKLKSKGDQGWDVRLMNNFIRRTLSMKSYERSSMIEDLESDKIIECSEAKNIKGIKSKNYHYIGTKRFK